MDDRPDRLLPDLAGAFSAVGTLGINRIPADEPVSTVSAAAPAPLPLGAVAGHVSLGDVASGGSTIAMSRTRLAPGLGMASSDASYYLG